MGTSYRRLEVQVAGSDSGFMALMRNVTQGITRVGQGLRSSERDAGLFSKQLLAVGTTARYALAGQLVFGITAAISRMSDFKAELGTIDSLAGQIDKNGNFKSIGNQLDQVGTQAILASNKVGVGVSDIESYMQRFFSSFDVPGNMAQRMKSMDAFVDRVTQLQAMMGSEAGDPQQLAGGIAGLINQIPGGTKNIGGNTARIANMIAYMTRVTPNITGRDVSRDIGRVGATMTMANMTPEQAFAVWGTAGMAGGSSSVIGRGVAQLLGTALLHPNTAKQKQAYAAAGLPTDPTTLREMGGFSVLTRMLGATGSGVRLTKAQRSMLNSDDVTDADAVTQLGQSGINLTQIYSLLGSHQESVRQFVNLLGQGGVKALQQYIKHQQQAIKVDQAKQRFEAANSQRTLARFTQARQNLSLSLVQGANWPIEHLLADPTIWLSSAAARHRTATQGVVAGGLGLGAANALRKLGAFSKLGRLGKYIGLASGIEQAAIGGAIAKEELPAAIAGTATDGTRANPFWVIISPLSWSIGSPGGLASPVPGKDKVPTPIGWFKGLGGRISPYLKSIGIPAAAAAIPALWNDLLDHRKGRTVPKGHPLLAKYADQDYMMGRGASFSMGMPKGVEDILNRYASGKLTADRAEALLRGPGSPNNPINVQGHATLDINVNSKNADGTTSKTRQKAHIKIIPAKSYPTKQGKPGSRKGGQ